MENQMKTAIGKIPKQETGEKQQSGKSRSKKTARDSVRENPSARNRLETAFGKIPKAKSGGENRENAEKKSGCVNRENAEKIAVSENAASVAVSSMRTSRSTHTESLIPHIESLISHSALRSPSSLSLIPLHTENLSVGYGKKIIIPGINLAVESGKIIALIGPNGSGKSTLLKTLANEISSLGGKVFLLGKNISALAEKEIAPHLSILMTERLKSGKMTCREVVATGRYPYTGRLGLLSPDDWKRTDEAISLVHAEEVAESLFSEVSDGQKQRIMLARAVAQDTEVIVLDEPTSFLDLRHKIDLMKIVRSLAREQKKAVVLSLHELELVKIVSDVVVCLDGKKIVRTGSPSEIFKGGFINRLYSLSESEFDAEKCRLNLNFDDEFPQKNPENENKNTEIAEKHGDSFQSENIQKQDIQGGPAQCAVAMSKVPPSASLLRSRLPRSLRNAPRLFQRCRNESSARKNQKSPKTKIPKIPKNPKIHRAKVIMVQGTMSNAGKSFIVAGLCRVFAQDGYRLSSLRIWP